MLDIYRYMLYYYRYMAMKYDNSATKNNYYWELIESYLRCTDENTSTEYRQIVWNVLARLYDSRWTYERLVDLVIDEIGYKKPATGR